MKIKNIKKSHFQNKKTLEQQRRKLEILKACRIGSFYLFLGSFLLTIIKGISLQYLDMTGFGCIALSFLGIASFLDKKLEENTFLRFEENQEKKNLYIKCRNISFIVYLVAYPSAIGKFLEGNYSYLQNIIIGLLGTISFSSFASITIFTTLIEDLLAKEKRKILEQELDIIDLDTEEGELRLSR